MRLRSRVLAAAAGLAAVVSLASCSEPAPPDRPDPQFAATISTVPDDYRSRMIGVTWKPECPVPIDDLRIIDMNHWGFDGAVHDGRMMVHKDVAEAVAAVFGKMFDARFPIRQMKLMEEYDADDDAAMADDNSSSFDCRQVTGRTDKFSNHSYGLAIDVNTRENPYVNGDRILPPEGVEFLDRTDVRPGMVTDGDVVWQAFADAGFVWGGDWIELSDYQHFELESISTRARKGQ